MQDLIEEIERISTNLEYDANLDLALKKMGLKDEEATTWAWDATNEQVEADAENKGKLKLEMARKKAEKHHALVRARRALKNSGNTVTAQNLHAELENLVSRLESMKM